MPMHKVVCKLIDERLVDRRASSDQDYLSRLITLLKAAVVQLYHPDTSFEFVGMRKVFEETFAAYVYEQTEFVEGFVEELQDYTDFVVRHGKLGFFVVPDEMWQLGREIRRHSGMVRGIIDNISSK